MINKNRANNKIVGDFNEKDEEINENEDNLNCSHVKFDSFMKIFYSLEKQSNEKEKKPQKKESNINTPQKDNSFIFSDDNLLACFSSLIKKSYMANYVIDKNSILSFEIKNSKPKMTKEVNQPQNNDNSLLMLIYESIKQLSSRVENIEKEIMKNKIDKSLLIENVNHFVIKSTSNINNEEKKLNVIQQNKIKFNNEEIIANNKQNKKRNYNESLNFGNSNKNKCKDKKSENISSYFKKMPKYE